MQRKSLKELDYKSLQRDNGSEQFKQEYVAGKIDGWIAEIEKLGEVAKVEPHVAYCAFVFGLQHRYTYLLRTIPNISEELKRLDQAIDNHLVKHLIHNNYSITELDRLWFSLPARLGGLGLNILSEVSDIYYGNSRRMTDPLVKQIIYQHDPEFVFENNERPVKAEIKEEKKRREEEKVNLVKQQLNPQKLKVYAATTEKGASNWLNSLPLKEHDFCLNKQTFWDSIHLRYGLPLPRLPVKCVCDASFNVEHALTCKKGGFVTIRHNEVRDFTAELLSEVCKDVASINTTDR